VSCRATVFTSPYSDSQPGVVSVVRVSYDVCNFVAIIVTKFKQHTEVIESL